MTRALVDEFMENGSLDRLLFSEEITLIEWPKLHEITIGTVKGTAYLHEECQERIVHYDIKPGNVLLDRNMSPKVVDFVLSKLGNDEGSRYIIEVIGKGSSGVVCSIYDLCTWGRKLR
ncbi:hypothetical protein CRG98_045296 [Punica granatum]|uniref:non-specific serine/threonine protein kinase n=1 Tax=Punica granatum TaxID=22663 RepID=A0A2I0HRH0_PUNGR|nr:hypothetical protein CRG98_045296 [Punica granatum]